MGMLTREMMLKPEELRREKVEFDSGDFVYIRQITGAEREQFEEMTQRKEDTEDGRVRIVPDLSDFRAKLAVMTVCDEKGNLIFKPSDVAGLSNSMTAQRLGKIADAAAVLNRMSQVVAGEKARDALGKPSGRGTGGDSPSASV